MNKRGKIIFEELIFILLNLVFFAVLLIFILQTTGGKAALEEKYAKEIALLIDEAKPKMIVAFDLNELVKKSKKSASEIVKINNQEKKVFINLKTTGGYSYKYFTDAKISYEFKENKLLLNVTS